jgi:hypothetical protein
MWSSPRKVAVVWSHPFLYIHLAELDISHGVFFEVGWFNPRYLATVADVPLSGD